MKAFVLGAGLGTRLLPLTEWLPKPLIPVFHRPLITYAFDHVISAGATAIMVNTHHCPEAYEKAFPDRRYRGVPLAFRHEPVLLETAGGIVNIADWLGNERLLVYNGDILSDAPLAPLLDTHKSEGNEVTLCVRSEGPGLFIGLREGASRVEDIRSKLGRPVDRAFQFTGIYVLEPAFLKRLTPNKKESVIPIFLEMIDQGASLAACVSDTGRWWDLGDEETYRHVHRWIRKSDFPSYAKLPTTWTAQHKTATIAATAELDEATVVGPEASIGDGARLTGVIVWPGGEVAPNAVLKDTVIRGPRATVEKWLAAD